MQEYRERASSTADGVSVAGTSDLPGTEDVPQYMSLTEQYGLSDEMEIGGSNEIMQTIEQEYQAYTTASLQKVDILKFWEVGGSINGGAQTADRILQMNRSTFPTLFAMAMDYLPIQATAVPCEQIFSSSAETDTKRRSRISALLMEALQILKFRFKKERLSFMKGWMTKENQLIEDDEGDLLWTLIDADTPLQRENNFDTVIRSIQQHED